MRKRAGGKTSGRSRRARPRKSTSARSSSSSAIRAGIARSLDWGEAHADFDRAIDGIPPELRGRRVDPLPHSAWEVLEHLRIAQHDILDFARNADYTEMKWPDEYWPPAPAPPDGASWDRSVAQFRHDREATKQLATD